MGSSYDLTSVYVTNILGITLIGVLLVCNLWRLRDKKKESHYVISMMFLILSSCIMDPLVYTLDGRPGKLAWAVVFFGNSWLYIVNVFVSSYWVKFTAYYANGFLPRPHMKFINLMVLIGFVILVVNCFVPVAFEVDANNVYSRRPLFFAFLAINYLIMFDVIFVYIVARHRGVYLKFLPAWIFMIPAFVGALVQSLFYGGSVIAACSAISLVGALASLQNDYIFLDGLTGLRNRIFLDRILKESLGKKKTLVTGIMLDLNGFKAINDKYGHAVGDQALIFSAEILRKAVSNVGFAIRYAGDEFVVLAKVYEDDDVQSLLQKIREGFMDFNRTRQVPYRLSVSIGYSIQDMSSFDSDEFIKVIDERMYEDKKSFYTQHGDLDRRSR